MFLSVTKSVGNRRQVLSLISPVGGLRRDETPWTSSFRGRRAASSLKTRVREAEIILIDVDTNCKFVRFEFDEFFLFACR